MKILHAACLLRPSMGIVKQMSEEKYIVDKLGLDWSVRFFLPKGQENMSSIIKEAKYTNSIYLNRFIYKLFAWFFIRIEYYIWLSQQKEVDIFLIRYSVHDVFQLMFLLLSKKPVFLVHHTLEEPELKMNNNFLGKLRYFSEKIIGKFCINASYGIVGVTNEIVEYEKSRIKNNSKRSLLFPNGINIRSHQNNDVFPNLSTIKILFVASEFSEWHGLDLILDDMKSNNNPSFELHLVGKLLSQDLECAKKDSRIILHGIQNKEFIENLANQCHVALGSFALERKNMKEACTLKVREYLSLGLPVYSGHKDVFPESFKFYKLGKPKINEILNYATDCSSYNRSIVVEEARNYIDKSVLTLKLYTDLKDLTNL
ncbi:glycosyltransferase family 1 protein [Acinetobacter oleivorans]|uniref:glycosyltransferase family 1 protein n=1 Tax=Acinetobacter oleivorans TaxID=1148157 RepID=UPI003A835141